MSIKLALKVSVLLPKDAEILIFERSASTDKLLVSEKFNLIPALIEEFFELDAVQPPYAKTVFVFWCVIYDLLTLLPFS